MLASTISQTARNPGPRNWSASDWNPLASGARRSV
jgi:hypothetical protein